MEDENGRVAEGGPDPTAAPKTRYEVGFRAAPRNGISLANDAGRELIVVHAKTDETGRIMASLVEAAGMLLDREAEMKIVELRASASSINSVMNAIGLAASGGKPGPISNLREGGPKPSITGMPRACPRCGSGMRSDQTECTVCEMINEEGMADAQEAP